MKLLVAALVSVVSISAIAKNKNEATVEIKDARIFAPLKGSNATAGYGVLVNKTAQPIEVTLEKAEGFKAVELHESLNKNGHMAMQKIEKLTLEAQKSFEMKPGAHHIMLFDATKNFKDGDMVKVSFKVGNKSETHEFKIVPRIEKKDEGHHHH